MKEQKYMNPLLTKTRIIGLIIAIIIHIVFIWGYIQIYEYSTALIYGFSIFFPIFMIYIYSKLFFSLFYRAKKDNKEIKKQIMNASVSLVVPFYNEKKELMEKQVESILKQTKPFDQVYFVDDGSIDKETTEFLSMVCDKIPSFHLHVCEENKGKREAQGKVLNLIDSDFIMTTDSDTFFKEDCLYELLIPFFENKRKKDVVAVTGKVVGINENKNLLTSILNMRYYNAFESERGSQSATQSVIVASGPCTVYRADIIQDNLHEYLNQIFLGKKQTFGDDRCLTNISLKYGDVLFQNTAVAMTFMPENMKSFMKQQIRWNRSFFRESLLGVIALTKLGRIKPLLWIIMEVLLFVLMLTTLSLALYSMFFQDGYFAIEFFSFTLFIIVNSIARNIYYFRITSKAIFLAPIYGFIHLLIIMPIKVYALFTLKDIRWITR